MMLLWKICLFACIFLALYPLLVYPMIIRLISLFGKQRVRRAPYCPEVTILIPAYNEVSSIGQTIENKLAQDYPADKLQILVVSDASDDGTDEVVSRYAARGVRLLRRAERAGKAAGLNAGIRQAGGSIVIFSDANSQFATDAISRLAENFADSDVGYVTGHLTLRAADARSGGSSAYMVYENWLRRLETDCGSVIGVNGGVDAMRRHLYVDVPSDQITDFVLPLHVIESGSRVVFDERACSVEDANEDSGTEFRMRVRVALRALRGLVYMKSVLHPLRHPMASFCIISHKVLRYFTFLFLAGALIANVVLAFNAPLYGWLLFLQLLCYGAALLGLWRALPDSLARLTMLPGYFLVSNAAFAVAAVRFMRGDVVATWKPRSG